MLLLTYQVVLPTRSASSRQLPGVRDAAATALLRSYQPEILDDAIPLSIFGDGNCLFRALSRGLFGDEDSHELIRLLTAIEICEHRHHYDTSDSQYCDSVQDIRLLHDSYDALLMSVTKPGGFSEMMVLFAASAALGVSIHSYCPPVITGEFATDALTRNVSGRGVPVRTPAALTVMWSTVNGTDRRRAKSWFRPKSLCCLASC